MIEEHCVFVDDLASINDPKHLFNVLSSAKLQRSSSSIDSSKLLIKMLNKKGPKTYPYGRHIISNPSLKGLLIFTLCLLFVR